MATFRVISQYFTVPKVPFVPPGEKSKAKQLLPFLILSRCLTKRQSGQFVPTRVINF